MNTTAKNESGNLNDNPAIARRMSRIIPWVGIGVATFFSAIAFAQATEPTVVAHTVSSSAKTYPNSETALTALAKESDYVNITRNYLQSIARYPASRETSLQHPLGEVAVWLEIERNGTLTGVGIAKSSDSMPLDSAAIATVRRAKYSPWPADLYPGESHRRFTIVFEYRHGENK